VANPSVKHSGFLVPNARGVADPAMAEPDQIDFNTIANARWGVIEGCKVEISGKTASTVGGTALVNGVIVALRAGSVDLTTGGAQDRFDLIAVNSNGELVKMEGSTSADPVFPDLTTDLTLLAAVFCGAGTGEFANNLIDKRKFVADSLLTKLPSNSPLIRNVNGTGDFFRVDGSGRTTWMGDTFLERSAAETLRVTRHLDVFGNLSIGGTFAAQGSISSALGTVSATNLRRGTALPGTASLGDMFQNTATGKVYAYMSIGWVELAGAESTTPYGTIIMSMRPKAEMTPLGWVSLEGQRIYENPQNANLFKLPALADTITGTAPTRQLVLPDMRQRFPMIRFGVEPGTVGGADSFTLTVDQMPKHKHDVSAVSGGKTTVKGRTGEAGGHRHTTTTGGRHGHTFDEGDGHAHHGMDNDSEGYVIATMVNGGNSIDAFFNDSSHTYTVRAAQWTRRAKTNAIVREEGSYHDHTISYEDAHTHPISDFDLPNHEHSVVEEYRGSGRAVTFTPPYLTVYAYMKM
jgi:hypothetical protein